jgi:uncharacterized membrane protein YvlD (DUF360 family)
MTLELFISILVISATATSIAIEIIKTLLEKAGITYKSLPLAIIISFVIGVAEIIIYAFSSGFSYMTIIYALCMGLANSVASNVGYDKVKAFIYALYNK